MLAVGIRGTSHCSSHRCFLAYIMTSTAHCRIFNRLIAQTSSSFRWLYILLWVLICAIIGGTVIFILMPRTVTLSSWRTPIEEVDVFEQDTKTRSYIDFYFPVGSDSDSVPVATALEQSEHLQRQLPASERREHHVDDHLQVPAVLVRRCGSRSEREPPATAAHAVPRAARALLQQHRAADRRCLVSAAYAFRNPGS